MLITLKRGIRLIPSRLVSNTPKLLLLANALEEKGVAPSAPMNIAKTIEWLAKRTGTEVLAAPIAGQIAGVSQRLINVLTKEHTRAETHPIDCIAAL